MVGGARPYHHGDLRSALIEAGLDFARDGGPSVLGLRELARSVGVTPNAVYRHFADRQALVFAIAVEAQRQLAHVMYEKMRTGRRFTDPKKRAIHRLRGVGLGYIDFALSEPGWFEVAILTWPELRENTLPISDEDGVASPYQLLLNALDDMVDAGVITARQRKHAEWVCWSGVHGFAELATHGPLKAQDRKAIDKLAAHLVDSIIKGIIA